MNDIVAIVVTYNRLELLKECIQSLQSQSIPLDILVVDNNSNDGTRDYVESLVLDQENIIYRNTGKNLGGAGGFNFGVKQAANLNYKYVWIMDDDCIVQQNTLTEFLNFTGKNKETYGFLASKVLWRDSSLCTMNIQRKSVYRNVTVKEFNEPIIKVKMSSFVSLFIPMCVVKEVGFPIKDFFIWSDDWEYTRRISRKYTCYLLNNSTVVHKSKSNKGADISTADWRNIDRFNYLYRNDVYLYRREGVLGWTYQAFRLPYHILKVLLKAPNNKIKRIGIIVRATLKGLTFYPNIEF
ncbi:MAG: glycosyltransferase family 2 protein [Veillonella sp.]|uniref:glycosyltransferase family 2 protein n=1 Tax=Veillonella sp. TaxID=1926307 RepID=UPI0025FC5BA9|nr:glycosyltransferase family 2 protein [Veillonella sp.]MBS4913647.1 glycosyltransferase family 2 protein [Veillonella sp.]